MTFPVIVTRDNHGLDPKIYGKEGFSLLGESSIKVGPDPVLFIFHSDLIEHHGLLFLHLKLPHQLSCDFDRPSTKVTG